MKKKKAKWMMLYKMPSKFKGYEYVKYKHNLTGKIKIVLKKL